MSTNAKPKYSSKLHLRCADGYTISYMYTHPEDTQVRLCVFRSTGGKTYQGVQGDGQNFPTLGDARKYAYDRGYLETYIPKNKKD